MGWMQRAAWFLIDMVTPWPEAKSRATVEQEKARAAVERAESESRVSALSTDAERLKVYVKALNDVSEEENKRAQGVEARLTTLLGLSSIAGTIVFGGIVSNFFSSSASAVRVPTIIVTFGVVYLALQICMVVLNAVKGLQRRSYLGTNVSDHLPEENESDADHLRRRMLQISESIADARTHTDSKVSRMAAAHRAMLNFLVVLVVLATVTAGFSLTRKETPSDLLTKLQQSRAVFDALRGPTGAIGPMGPQGPPGAAGAAAQPCQCVMPTRARLQGAKATGQK